MVDFPAWIHKIMIRSFRGIAVRGGFLLLVLALALTIDIVESRSATSEFPPPFWYRAITQQSSYGAVVYFALPAWLFFAGFSIPRRRRGLELIRIGSHSALLFRWFVTFVVPHAVAISVIVFIAAIATSIGLPVGSYGTVIEDLPMTERWWWHSSPALAALLSGALTAALFCAYAVVLYVVVYRRSTVAIVAASVALYILSMVLVRSPFVNFFGIRYLSSWGGNLTPESALQSIATLCMIPVTVIVGWWTFEHRPWQHQGFIRGFATLGAATLLLGILAANSDGNLAFVLRSLFETGGSGRIDFPGVALFVLTFIVSSALGAARFTRGSGGTLSYIAIRSGSLNRWFRNGVISAALASAGFMACFLMFVSMVVLFSGARLFSAETVFVVASLFVIGVCQLMIFGVVHGALMAPHAPAAVTTVSWMVMLILSLPMFSHRGLSPFGLPHIGDLEPSSLLMRTVGGVAWLALFLAICFTGLRARVVQSMLLSRIGV